jgi:hypothetical protein
MMVTSASTDRLLSRPLRLFLMPLFWLERARGRRRLALLLAYGLVAAALGLLTWRVTCLNSLPDVGDPPDLATLRSLKVPDERNAYVLYRAAVGQLTTSTALQDGGRMWGVIRGGWSKADPEIRRCVDENRATLALWREGTERPDALEVPYGERTPFLRRPTSGSLPSLVQLALLEGSRLEEAGDRAGAWGWYKAVLRCSRHAGLRGGWTERSSGHWLLSLGNERVDPWLRDPEVDAALLRRAIGDLEDLERMTVPASATLKVDHLTLLNGLADPDRLMLEYDSLTSFGYEDQRRFHQAGWFLLNEPERSRRLARLLLANRLAYCDLPPASRPSRIDGYALGNTSFDLGVYAAGPEAPPEARLLSVDRLARWYLSTQLLCRITGGFQYLIDACDWERSIMEKLLLTAAEQCYEREQGAPPPSPEMLVGRYLKRLPERYGSHYADAPEGK